MWLVWGMRSIQSLLQLLCACYMVLLSEQTFPIYQKVKITSQDRPFINLDRQPHDIYSTLNTINQSKTTSSRQCSCRQQQQANYPHMNTFVLAANSSTPADSHWVDCALRKVQYVTRS